MKIASILLLSAAQLFALASQPAGLSESELEAQIAKHRQGTLAVRGAPGAKATVEQLSHAFWFGATLPASVFTGSASERDRSKFREVFLSHFNAGVIESAFKWHEMEREPGKVDFSAVDQMLDWADANRIPLRGHCIFWGVPRYVQPWVQALPDEALKRALAQRARTVAARYLGRFAEYDLNNEMMHANLYAERLGPGITNDMARWVKAVDPQAKLYFNDYDITTGRRLDDYVKHIREVLASGAPMDGIGVQGHLHGDSFDPEELKRSLDVLAQFKLPIRITEFNFPGQRSKYYKNRDAVLSPDEELAKAKALVDFYRICFAHPAVTGILMWGFWEGANWIPQSSLYKRDWTPTPAAQAYKDLIYGKWWTRWEGTVGESGTVQIKAFRGRYRVTVGGAESIVGVQ